MSNVGTCQAIIDSGNKMMQMIKEGEVHMHIMGNSSVERYGEQEHREMMEYSDFIKTKFCFDLMSLTGMGEHE
uniref:hypothetical protein n=1 Tax=Acetatifactor sp. TaxID=1872090 RepID=UPI004056A112